MYNFGMIKRTLLVPTLGLILFLLVSCAPQKRSATPDPNLQILIDQAVSATLVAMPAPTQPPLPTPYPTPTPISLAGIYCEYQFCIGHPAGMAYYDHLATLDVGKPSAYGNGFLAAYQVPNVLVNLIWLQAPNTSDPKFLLDTILDKQSDTMTGSLEVKLIHSMNVVFTTITTSINGFPSGAAAAWTCGDRVFAWKVYTSQSETAVPLFDETLARFTCGQ
jgi:hypothetical protein